MKSCTTCQRTYPDDFSLCPHDGTQLAAQATETEAQLAAGLSRRFRIVRRLGKGGMGTVFLAEQIGVGNRPVALKVLNRKLLDDPDFLMRFQNEAGSTGRIHHPNVVTIYESAQSDDGTPYIAMEFLEGESLHEVLKQRGALPLTEVAEILQQAAGGLSAAHKLGIIHRDLKPDNIFLTYPDDDSVARVSPPAQTVTPASPPAQVEGALAPTSPQPNVVVKIVDFGIAKLRESGAHTQTGMVLGTPAYMSFEQASGMRSDELDARSDIYSLGVVVYEMLTGRTPFHSDTPVGYLRMHMQEDPPPFRTIKPDLPALPQIESVVMKALTKDREQRYGSALEFASGFAKAAVAAPRAMPPASAADRGAVQEPLPPRPAVPNRPPAVPPTPPAPQPQPAARPQPKRRLRIATLAAFVVLVTVAVLLWLYRPRSQPEEQPKTLTTEKLAGTRGPQPAQTTQLPLQGTGAVRENLKDGLKYVWIPPGTFMMGCSPGDDECGGNENPAHQVTITKGFWIGQTPVTVGGYKRFAGATGRQMPPRDLLGQGSSEHKPIVMVSWDDAQAYCAWEGGRLPTEAEWEYAARGGSTEASYGPIDEVAWYKDNSGDRIHDVGQKRANGFGLYDMLGNVEEWVNDWSDQKYYQGSPSQDPQGPGNGQYRVLRGGSWTDRSWDVRVSNRSRGRSDLRVPDVGFRCAAEVGSL